MRITYRDRRYSIDRAAYTAFLKEQGFTNDDIDWLNIYVQEMRQGKPNLLGEFRGPNTVFLYTQNRPVAEVNRTLLHETRHYWQDREEEKQLYDAAKRLKGPPFQRFYWEWLSQTRSARHGEYWDRPIEQDARAFAAKFADQRLISLSPGCSTKGECA